MDLRFLIKFFIILSFSSFNRTMTNNSNYHENFFVIPWFLFRISRSISHGYPKNTRRFGWYLVNVLNCMIGSPIAKGIPDLKGPDDLASRCTFRSREPVHTSSFACLLIYLFIQDASNARRFMNTILDISRLLWSRRFHGKLLTVGLPASWSRSRITRTCSYQPRSTATYNPVSFLKPSFKSHFHPSHIC